MTCPTCTEEQLDLQISEGFARSILVCGPGVTPVYLLTHMELQLWVKGMRWSEQQQ